MFVCWFFSEESEALFQSSVFPALEDNPNRIINCLYIGEYREFFKKTLCIGQVSLCLLILWIKHDLTPPKTELLEDSLK